MTKIKLWFQNIGLMLTPIWKQDKMYFITFIVWDCIQSPISTMLYVYLMQISINQLSMGAEIWTVATTVIIFLICELLVHIGGDLLYSLYFEPRQDRIITKINLDICEHIKHTDYKYFDDPDYYDEYTVSYAEYASKSIDTFSNLSSLIALIVTVGSLVGYILSSSVYVVVITLISVIIKVYVSKIVNKIQVQEEEESALIDRKTGYYRETICSREAAMDMKSTNMYDIFVEHYRHSANQGNKLLIKYNKKSAFWKSIQALSTDGSSAMIRIILCSLIVAGRVGVGSFVSLLSAANSLAWKIQNISKYYTLLDKSALYGKKIRHFVNQPSQIENVFDNKNNLGVNTAFSLMLKNVCFNYDNSNFVINNMNLEIESGKKIAIVGENGAGKTTLTKLLLRLYDPVDGEIMINGISLKDLDLASYRANVGVAFQESPMYSLSLRDNLSAYKMYKDSDFRELFSTFCFEDILNKCGATIDTDVTKKFSKGGIMLSGGERQKMAVSRLFNKEFGLLIFDEPTSSLDPFAEDKLNQMIFDKSNGTTTILISHRLSNVVKADCIYVMREGMIVEKGTHSELIEKKGTYFNMFELQAKKYQKV